MNVSNSAYRAYGHSVRTKIVVSISGQLIAEGIKSLLISRGYLVETLGRKADFAAICDRLSDLDSGDNVLWILDLKALINVVPVEKREIIRKQTVLFADSYLTRMSRNYLAEAAAIVSTDSSFQELDNAIRAVAKGKSYFDPRLSHFRIDDLNGGRFDLTLRQLQILRMVAEGMSSRNIAAELLLSRRTIENHRAQILERLGFNSTAEMVDFARDKNWI